MTSHPAAPDEADVSVPAAKPPTQTLLVTLNGRDRPGVTTTMFDVLAGAGVQVLDIEQIVMRGHLILGILVTAPRDRAKLQSRLAETAEALGMELDLTAGSGDNQPRRRGRAVVTVFGAALPAAAIQAVTGRIADTGANIDRIIRLSRHPVTAIEFHVSGTDVGRLRTLLAAEAVRQRVDVAVQPVGLLRHGRRLIVMDVDSTLVQGEAIDDLAALAGVEDEVARVTRAAMNGELDFEESLRSRVALLEGLDAAALDRVYADLTLTPGAETLVDTLVSLGYQCAIVSGGFSQITDRLAADLGIHHARANELEIVEGKLTGRVLGAVVDRAAKAEALREFARSSGIPLNRTVAVGDGANDLDMLQTAGLGIAFNAKQVVQEAAHTSVNVPYLDTILYLLGINREDIDAAPSGDPADSGDPG